MGAAAQSIQVRASLFLADRRKSLTVPGANKLLPSAAGASTKSASSSPVGDSVPISGGGGGGGGHVKLPSVGDTTGSPRHRGDTRQSLLTLDQYREPIQLAK